MGIFSRPYNKKRVKRGDLYYSNQRELTPFGWLFLIVAIVVNFLVMVYADKDWFAISTLVSFGVYFLIKYLADGSVDK